MQILKRKIALFLNFMDFLQGQGDEGRVQN